MPLTNSLATSKPFQQRLSRKRIGGMAGIRRGRFFPDFQQAANYFFARFDFRWARFKASIRCE
jgi:hypothetical protein